MSNLDNLISKIIKDSEEKAKAIIEAANERADEIVSAKTAEANKQKSEILSTAEYESKRVSEQILSANKLGIRDDILGAKRELIDKVLSTALETLNNLTEDDYYQFVLKSVMGLGLSDDGTIIVPPKYAGFDIEKLNAELKANHNHGTLKLNTDSNVRKINGGFILVHGGVERNNTFEALLSHNYNELEGILIKNLF